MTYEELFELYEFQKQQLNNLTAEKDRLRDESANASESLIYSNERNSILSQENQQLNDDIASLVEEVYEADVKMIGD